VTAEAERLISEATFHWHQRFLLAPGVYTPGANDLARLFEVAQVPRDLGGLTVLDVGTSNGGACFEAERRGASRVVATDITPIGYCGFDRLRTLLGSRAEFVQTTVYELPEKLGGEQFDLVFFWGVLYHLRHPLHALDRLRRVVRGAALIETAVCDADVPPRVTRLPLVRFYRGAGLDGDESNWFAPTTQALLDWCRSSGFEATLLGKWPAPLTRVRMLTVLDRLDALVRRRQYVPIPRLARRRDRTARRAMVRVEPTRGEAEFKRLSWAEEL
jgi:tRNA (mo5U34)-methyltransferase